MTATKRRIGRRIGIATAALAVAVGALNGGPVSAETIEVPVATAYVSGDAGTVHEIGTADVPADLVGRACTVNIAVTNQESIHPGNELIVASDGSQVSVAGVEDEAGEVTQTAGELTLGSTISVSVKLGDDGSSSLGSNLTVTCEPLPVAPPAKPVVQTPTYTG